MRQALPFAVIATRCLFIHNHFVIILFTFRITNAVTTSVVSVITIAVTSSVYVCMNLSPWFHTLANYSIVLVLLVLLLVLLVHATARMLQAQHAAASECN